MRPSILLPLLLLAACGGPGPTTGPPSSLDDLPLGPVPRIGYVAGAVHHGPDGTTTLPRARARGVLGLVSFDGGLLVSDLRFFEGTNGIALVTGTASTDLHPCTSGVAATDGNRAAWTTFACPESGEPAPSLLHVVDAGVETTHPIEVEPGADALTSVVGFLHGEVVVSRGFVGGSLRVDAHGVARRLPGVTGVQDVDERGGLLVAGLPGGEEVGVVEARTGEVLWRAAAIGPFSPDGTRVASALRGVLSIADARTGRRLHTAALPPGSAVTGIAWEDDDHVLVVAMQAASDAVVRWDGRDRLERAIAVRAVPERRLAWHVLERVP